MDEYAGRVQVIIWRAVDFVTAEGVKSAQHLADHGEPAEGMLALAWVISGRQAVVPDDLAQDIYDHGAELVPADIWPPGLPPGSS